MCAKCPVVRKLLRSPLSLHPNVDKVCLTHDRELLRLRHPAKRKSMSQSTYQMLKSLQIFHYLGNSAGKRKKQARVLDQSCFDSYAICTCYFENPYRESLYGGQFTLSTPLIKPNFCILLPHRRSTTVSLETTPSSYRDQSSLF